MSVFLGSSPAIDNVRHSVTACFNKILVVKPNCDYLYTN